MARLACSEAGYDKAEAKRVLRVVYNRARSRKTSVMEEAKRPGQFYAKNCTGNREKWLRWHHLELAAATLNGTIKAEASINSPKVTYFGTTKRLNQKHSRCSANTIREVWEWYGLRKVLTTEVGHEYYAKHPGKPGCPEKASPEG